MQYWSAVDILKQLSAELGIPQQTTVVNSGNVQGSQLLAHLNSSGNELQLYYPWSQFQKTWEWTSVAGQDNYDLPADWRYFIDQTQWDKTNRWPLMGPKSPQEWQWLKNGIVATFPRTRYRVIGSKFYILPTPAVGSLFSFAMEYISGNWVSSAGTPRNMITTDGDICQYDPWLLIKFAKMKWLNTKNLDPNGVATSEFTRVFESLTGKDVGAPVLSLTPIQTPMYIGPQSVPDGSWQVGP